MVMLQDFDEKGPATASTRVCFSIAREIKVCSQGDRRLLDQSVTFNETNVLYWDFSLSVSLVCTIFAPRRGGS